MPGILNEDERQLPRGVTTKTGNYTAGTPITSRSAPRSVNPTKRVELGFELPAFAKPAPPSAGRYTQSNVQANRSAQGLVAPPVASSQADKPGVSIIPAAEARSAGTQQGAVRSPTTNVPNNATNRGGHAGDGLLAPAKDSLPAGVRETKNVYSIAGINRYDDASGVPTFTNKGRAGYAEMQGMADTPALQGARAPSPTATLPQPGAKTPGPSPAASGGGGTFSVVPGLFSGVSRETEQALSEARQAASARGDFEAVERSFLTTPAERAEYDAGKAERRILERLPNLPAAEQTKALTALTARKGKPLSLDQFRAQQAPQLLAGGEPTAGQNLLFGKTPPATQRRIVSQPTGEVDANGFPTETKQFFSVDPATGQAMPVDLAGGAQGQAASAASRATADANRAVKLRKLTRAQANERLRQAGFPEI